MTNNDFFDYKSRKPVSRSRSDLPASENQIAVEFVPSADEVARRAYFNYVNEGSPQGRDVQHWLNAEEELTKERNFTRAHGFHN